LSRSAKTLVDVEGVVDVRIVDQTLPSNRSPRLLEVAPHHNKQVVLVLLLELEQTVAVFQCHGRVVDRARPDHNHKPPLLVHAMYDLDGLFARVDHGLSRLVCLADLMLEEVWWGQRSHAADAPIFDTVLVAHRLVWEEELHHLLALYYPQNISLLVHGMQTFGTQIDVLPQP
jgi:hypothetical protein